MLGKSAFLMLTSTREFAIFQAWKCMNAANLVFVVIAVVSRIIRNILNDN